MELAPLESPKDLVCGRLLKTLKMFCYIMRDSFLTRSTASNIGTNLHLPSHLTHVRACSSPLSAKY